MLAWTLDKSAGYLCSDVEIGGGHVGMLAQLFQIGGDMILRVYALIWVESCMGPAWLSMAKLVKYCNTM